MIDNKTIRQVAINKALLPCTPSEKVLKEISSQAGETGFNFYTNLDDAMPKFDVTLTPAQASGTPSPENPLPIEGDNELRITQGAETGSGLSEVYVIPLGQTVYGGVVEVVEGELTIKWVDLYIDGSTSVKSVSLHGNSGLYYTVVENSLSKVGINSLTTDPHIISDKFLGASGVVVGHTYITGSGLILIAVLPDQTITTKEDATQWFVDNPTHFVYELATPIKIQLTPTEIKTFKKHTNKFRIRASYATEASYYTMEGGSCEISKQFFPIFYPNGKGVKHHGSTF